MEVMEKLPTMSLENQAIKQSFPQPGPKELPKPIRPQARP